MNNKVYFTSPYINLFVKDDLLICRHPPSLILCLTTRRPMLIISCMHMGLIIKKAVLAYAIVPVALQLKDLFQGV